MSVESVDQVEIHLNKAFDRFSKYDSGEAPASPVLFSLRTQFFPTKSHHQVVSLRTKYMALDILETELLPSDVIKIRFYRPPNFKYLSGQWVRLACTAFKNAEYHSFTLTSAPHENFLSCHIKAQGPWTWKLRNYFDPCNFSAVDNQPKVSN